MGHCKDCRHWTYDDYETESRTGIGDVPFWGTCALAKGRDGYADHPTSLAVASEAESYSATLVTREDFGCVQFEARDAD